MQYTIRNISKRLDKALRTKAKAEGKSINTAAIEALEAALGVAGDRPKRRDLAFLSGTWVEDPAFDKTIKDQRRIDPELWK